MKADIERLLISNACRKKGDQWFCEGKNETLNIARRPVSIARDRRNWSSWRTANYAFFKEHLESRNQSLTLIDLGAGPQHFLDITSQFAVCAVEFEPIDGIDVIADITKPLPFRDGVADIIMLSNVIEHIERPEQLLSECARILRPDGILIGTVPFMMASHQRPFDYHRYTDIGLTNLLQKYFPHSTVIPLGTLLSLSTDSSLPYFKALRKKHASSRVRYKGVVLTEKLHRFFLFILSLLWGDTSSVAEATQGYGFVSRR